MCQIVVIFKVTLLFQTPNAMLKYTVTPLEVSNIFTVTPGGAVTVKDSLVRTGNQDVYQVGVI